MDHDYENIRYDVTCNACGWDGMADDLVHERCPKCDACEIEWYDYDEREEITY